MYPRPMNTPPMNTPPDPARRPVRYRVPALVAVALALGLAAPVPAEAQYFGRNKVKYDRQDFRVLSTEHFDIYHHSEDDAAFRDAARMAERWNARLSALFDHTLSSRQPVILYADATGFQQTNVIGGSIDESTGGVTESLQRRVAMPLGASYRDTDHVLGHELVHAFQYDLARRHGGISRMSGLPLWTIEGMAEYLSLGRDHPQTAMWLRDAVAHDDIPTLGKLNSDWSYFPYRFGHAVWAYIGGRWGDDRIAPLYLAALRRGWDRGVREVLEITADSLSKEWVAAVRDAYTPLLEGRVLPDSVGRLIPLANRRGREMILAPALSPDGRHVAFLWARDFTIDLYMADARDGSGVRRLASGAASTRIDALSFMGSAGSWSPDGMRFVTVVFAGGAQELAIIDVKGGRIDRRIAVPGLTALSNPAWSPDGQSIAFSGGASGRRNLYLVRLADDRVERLTDDLSATLHPTWSPDGTTLAFVTDGIDSAGLEWLEHGPLHIALLDVRTREIRRLALVGGDNTDPQFAPDGLSMYFLADPDGFRDLYRVDLGSGTVSRLTNLATGISGLTPVSPALSVASRTGELVFSVFARRGYALAALQPEPAREEVVEPAGDNPPDPAGNGRIQEAEAPAAGRLPPFDPSADADVRGLVEVHLGDAVTGMPDTTTFETRDYSPRPRLSYVGIPTLGASFGGYGAGVYANAEVYFTDVLGDHGLYVQGMADGGVRELGGRVVYENQARRVGWAIGVGRIPEVYGYVSGGPVETTVGDEVVVGTAILEYRDRTIYDEAAVTARYPLSTTRRIEVGGGLLRIGRSIEVRQTIEVRGRVVDRQTIDLIDPVRFDFVQAGVALVGDHSVFGMTSPVEGGRYRFEIQPVFGSLDFMTALADWRTYRYLRPITLAGRAMHYGRYGADAEDPNLGLLFLGYPSLVRGYDYNSFTAADCPASPGGQGTLTGCATLDRLFGSRLAVASVELRAPLIGNDRFGLLKIPFLPTEVAAFVDAGTAWLADRPLSLETGPGDRGLVSSAGVTARFNVFGILVLETFYAVPFQRTTGGRFGLQIAPGW